MLSQIGFLQAMQGPKIMALKEASMWHCNNNFRWRKNSSLFLFPASRSSSMNSKLSNKFRINAKLRKKHFMFRTGSFTGRALQISSMALQNRRTTTVLTNSTVTAKPMNNAQQRGGKHANTETCRVNTQSLLRNGRTGKWEDRARHRPKILIN